MIRWQGGKSSLNQDIWWGNALVFEEQGNREDGRTGALYKELFLGGEKISACVKSRQDQVRIRFVRLINRLDSDVQLQETCGERIGFRSSQ